MYVLYTEQDLSYGSSLLWMQVSLTSLFVLGAGRDFLFVIRYLRQTTLQFHIDRQQDEYDYE